MDLFSFTFKNIFLALLRGRGDRHWLQYMFNVFRTDWALTVPVSLQPISTKYSRDANARDQWTCVKLGRLVWVCKIQISSCAVTTALRTEISPGYWYDWLDLPKSDKNEQKRWNERNISVCRMTNYCLLRWLVETPSHDIHHYRMLNRVGGRRFNSQRYLTVTWLQYWTVALTLIS